MLNLYEKVKQIQNIHAKICQQSTIIKNIIIMFLKIKKYTQKKMYNIICYM